MSKHETVRTILRHKQGNNCCYCGVQMFRFKGGNLPKGGLPPAAETLEHLRRKVDGGTNRTDNLALSCAACNSGRGSIDWLTYKSLKMGELQVAA
jgi:5-methylcytosine-specific restriction endonuclease McrA